MKKAALLVRVSTTKQDFQRQVDDLTAEALKQGYKQSELVLFGEIVSGYKNKKEDTQFTKLMNIIEDDPKYFNIIFVSEISRMGRNPIQLRQTIDRLSELKIPVHILSLNRATLDEKGNRDMIMNIILQVLIEYAHVEAETFKMRSRSGLLHSAKMGRAGGSTNFPYGYTKDINKMLVIEPTEAVVIKRIFDLYSKNNGTKVISHILNDDKIPTRMNITHADKTIKYRIEKTGSMVLWSDKQILDIVSNPLYKGERRYKGHTLKAPAIITPELFDLCNAIRGSKTHRHYLTTYTYLLKDIIKCGVCGRNMYARYKPVAGGDCVYVCSSTLKKGGGCGNKGINIDFIESVMMNQLLLARIPSVVTQKGATKVQFENEIEVCKRQLEMEQKNFKQKEKERERIIDLFITGMFEKPELATRQDKIDNVITASQNRINQLKKEIKAKLDVMVRQDNKEYTKADLKKLKHNREEMSNLMHKIINKLIVTRINDNEFFVSYWMNAYGADQAVKGMPAKYHFTNSTDMVLDKKALRSRYGGDLKYIFGGAPDVKYDQDVLVSDSRQHIAYLKKNREYQIPEMIKIG